MTPMPCGRRDVEALEKLVEAFAVLRGVDALGRGAEDLDPVLGRGICVSLIAVWPPKATTTPTGFSARMMFITSSRVSGSKYRRSAGVVVGRDGLGVVVDDDHVITELFQRPDAVDAGVVELDALADADRAASREP